MGAAVVHAWNVGGGEHRHHAGQRAQALEVDTEQAAVRHGRQAERGVQRAGGFGNVIHVRGLPADVQVGGFVRARDADDGFAARAGAFVIQVRRLLLRVVRRVHAALQTCVAEAGSGSCGRVSSQKRCSSARTERMR